MSPEDLMTAREAVKAFDNAGLSAQTFKRRVQNGLIEKILPQGRVRGALYPKDQVFAAIRNKKTETASTSNTLKIATFSIATPDDMEQIADLIDAIFDGRPAVDRWRQWIQRNPEIAYILKSEGKIVGCAFLIPLLEEKILEILSQELTPVTYPEEILTYQPGTPINLYARSVGIDPTVSHIQKRHWAGILVRNLIKVIINLGNRGIFLNKIYSRSETPDGKRILRHMGFTQIPTQTRSNNYVIDANTSGLDLIIEYKKALTQWQNKHSGDGA
jgi:hypothetical protein